MPGSRRAAWPRSAGVAQSTLMHHFPTREALLVETVTHLAMRLADDALDQLDLSGLRSPQQRDAILDQAWREFTSPPAIAAAQLWAAAWAEPELAAALRELEDRLGQLIVATAGDALPRSCRGPPLRPPARRVGLTHPRAGHGHPGFRSGHRRREMGGDQAHPGRRRRPPAGLTSRATTSRGSCTSGRYGWTAAPCHRECAR